MAENYLPSSEAVTILGGELLFRPDGAARERSMGHVDSWTWTPSIEEEDVYAATSGIRQKIKTITREVSVSIAATLKELTVANMAIATQGEVSAYTQPAVTAENRIETDVVPGESIDLGYLDVTNVVITDGLNPLVAGTDYTVNSEAGTITVRSAQATFDITFDAPEIAAGSRQMIEVFANQGGVEGVFTIIGKNRQGKRYKLTGVRAKLKPSGDVAFLSDGSSVQTIEIEGSGIDNSNEDPAFPWGRIIALN